MDISQEVTLIVTISTFLLPVTVGIFVLIRVYQKKQLHFNVLTAFWALTKSLHSKWQGPLLHNHSENNSPVSIPILQP